MAVTQAAGRAQIRGRIREVGLAIGHPVSSRRAAGRVGSSSRCRRCLRQAPLGLPLADIQAAPRDAPMPVRDAAQRADRHPPELPRLARRRVAPERERRHPEDGPIHSRRNSAASCAHWIPRGETWSGGALRAQAPSPIGGRHRTRTSRSDAGLCRAPETPRDRVRIIVGIRGCRECAVQDATIAPHVRTRSHDWRIAAATRHSDKGHLLTSTCGHPFRTLRGISRDDRGARPSSTSGRNSKRPQMHGCATADTECGEPALSGTTVATRTFPATIKLRLDDNCHDSSMTA